MVLEYANPGPGANFPGCKKIDRRLLISSALNRVTEVVSEFIVRR
jgi:hypothetical protein